MSKIRGATPDDLPALAALGHLAWEENGPVRDLSPAFDQSVAALLVDKSIGCFVIEREDGSLGGMLIVRLEYGFYFDELICANLLFYVLEELRGTNLPRRIVAFAEAWATENGCAQMHFSTMAPHLKSRHERFFSGLEYTVTGITAYKTLLPGVDNGFRRRRSAA